MRAEKPKLKRRRMLTSIRRGTLEAAIAHDGMIYVYGGWWPRLEAAGAYCVKDMNGLICASTKVIRELCAAGFLVANAWRKGTAPAHQALALLTDHGRDRLAISLFEAGVIVTRDELRCVTDDERAHAAVFADGCLSGQPIEPPGWMRSLPASWISKRRTWPGWTMTAAVPSFDETIAYARQE